MHTSMTEQFKNNFVYSLIFTYAGVLKTKSIPISVYSYRIIHITKIDIFSAINC